MPKIGTTLRPVKAEILRGGRATAFLVSESHPVQNFKWVNDGLVEVIVKGEYHWAKGDCIKILKINGWMIRRYDTRQYFRILAEIEYIPAGELNDRDERTQTLFEDVPEDYLNG